MASKKRKGYDSLTGGTKDVNPQAYAIFSNITQTSNVSHSFPLPVPRFGTFGHQRSIVFELLGVHWSLDGAPTAGTDGSSLQVVAAVTTNPAAIPASPLSADPRTLSLFNRFWFLPPVATPVPSIVEMDLTEYDDLTDAAGHGILVATDNIYLALLCVVNGSDPTLSTNITARLEYRMKEVTIEEYIGIVQGQQ